MRYATIALALGCATPALAQTGNLPGAEAPAAAPRPNSVAAHNQAAAALRADYERDVAAYRAALGNHARDAAAAAADAESFRHARPLAAPLRAPPTATAAVAASDITVTGARKRTCITVGGRPSTGSLITRQPPRLRCFTTIDEEREYARQREETDRGARELSRPKDGYLTNKAGTP